MLAPSLPDALVDLLGADHIVTQAETLAQTSIDGITPTLLIQAGDTDAVSASLGWANATGLTVVPRGAGTTLGLGEPPRRADMVLDLRRLDQVLEYEPADLTITVQAGLTLGQLQRVLGERGQWLPLDPPRGATRTLGGLIATGASGPHRYGFGTLRDRLIGLRMVQADGLIHRGGAKVVKNVAGYDLPKLLVGSLGTLGVFTEATLKLLPLPRAWGTAVVPCPTVAAATTLSGQIITSPLTPAAVCILDVGAVRHVLAELPGLVPTETDVLLVVRFAGIPQAVARQLNEVQALAERIIGVQSVAKNLRRLVNEDTSVWQTLADLPVALTANRAIRLKNAVLPTRVADALRVGQAISQTYTLPIAQIAHAGNGVIYATLRGFGPQDDLDNRLIQSATAWRQAIAELGGTTIIEHAPLAIKTAIGVWGPIRPDFRMMQALKNQFDPKGTLNPGRFVGGL